MKELKAFIHRNRAIDVVHALQAAGFTRLSAVDVMGLVTALDNKEQDYSTEIGTGVVTEVKVEVVCDNDQVQEAVRIIREQGATGQPESGWIYVSEISDAMPIS